MIRSILSYAFFLGLIIITGCSSDNQVKPLKPLHVATGNWEPYVGENLPHNGPLAEMVAVILVDLHRVPEFKFYDWLMIRKHLEAGYPSIAFPFNKPEQAERKGFHYSEPLLSFDYVLFYHKKNHEAAKKIKSLTDLNNSSKRIGRIRGYTKLPSIQNDSAYTEVASTVDGFNRLLNGDDMDYLLEGKIVGLRILQSQLIAADKDDFKYLGQPEGPHDQEETKFISNVDLHIMLSPRLDTKILDRINAAIGDPKNEEFFKSLRRRINANAGIQDTAFLVAPGNETISGFFNRTGKTPDVLIPGNSKVLVTDWGQAYQIKSETEQPNSGRSQVKLLNGPLIGKVVWVDHQYLILER